ncbi:50S ribosomal protein L10 [Blattabacterium punctulatus]|uniref:Large ribosomal subunit protein uL10 n=1 Tax=Blattabacterium punctulatus TaxID=164514 RepID=A0ABM6WMR0_9FLAO|nr:50S ribosomal protein L10 [Blattabacterium punctulatus]AWU39737.1 50S ribosomal protein L10 [Blattabacterium punctulatus]AWU40282.1 50S ribosomal protein L10 [Blattabacterium punctulatus]AWU42536.1 50S ribosomal protein L10 [Blattabacterium punctulatus]AWU43081.1 50S ribosomal protein L10 [Blattabacterium punctulatus]AWU44733.1 50S ribosomal protein L10 [Blattabacterium punctulatus]
MNKEKKRKELLKLISILSDNETIYLIDISDLNSNQISILRKNFNKFFIQMRVVKNTLLKKALEKIKNKKLDSFLPILNGNTSILSSNLGGLPSKIIKKFHFKENIEKPYLKAAYVEKSFYFGNKDLDILINFKSKKDLIIDILNLLQFPIEKILFSLKLGEYKIFKIIESLSS